MFISFLNGNIWDRHALQQRMQVNRLNLQSLFELSQLSLLGLIEAELRWLGTAHIA